MTGILPDKIRLAKDYVTRASVAFDLWMIVPDTARGVRPATRARPNPQRRRSLSAVGPCHNRPGVPERRGATLRHVAISFRRACRRGHHSELGCKGGAQMNRKRLAGAVLMSLVISLPVGQPRAQGVDLPVFEVDPSWPTLPDDWVLGQVASV